MNWSEYFIYDSISGSLIWSVDRGAARAGIVAGSVNRSGYRQVMVKKRYYGVHRVIWEMHNGPIPSGMQIDHIDHNSQNNLIQNLRLVTMQQNNKNHPISSRNSSGSVGVYFIKSSGRWCSQITVNGKVKHLGTFPDISQAIERRKMAEIENDYHP